MSQSFILSHRQFTSMLTVKHDWHARLVVDQRREWENSNLVGQLNVVSLDKLNVVLISVVVDSFKLLENFWTCLTFVAVCWGWATKPFIKSTTSHAAKYLLTEENSQMIDVVNQHLECTTVDTFNHIWSWVNQAQDPFQNLILIHQITIVDSAEFVAIECQSWQRWQIVFFFDTFIARLNKVDVLLFAFVVDVFELV